MVAAKLSSITPTAPVDSRQQESVRDISLPTGIDRNHELLRGQNQSTVDKIKSVSQVAPLGNSLRASAVANRDLFDLVQASLELPSDRATTRSFSEIASASARHNVGLLRKQPHLLLLSGGLKRDG